MLWFFNSDTSPALQKISFGDIPNSSSMDILMPWAPFCAMVLPMWTMLSAWSKQSPGCSCPGCKATNHTGTLRNLLNPCLRSYTNTRRNSPEPSRTFQDLPEPTFRNLPEPTSGTYASIRRNHPEPSGTRLRNLHQHTPELSGTFRNLPPEPAPATRTGTHRSLSGLKTPLAYAVGEKVLTQAHLVFVELGAVKAPIASF